MLNNLTLDLVISMEAYNNFSDPEIRGGGGEVSKKLFFQLYGPKCGVKIKEAPLLDLG